MNEIAWQSHQLTTPDLDIAWHDAGNGPPVLFLHGGPGHDHQFMRALAAPLTQQFRCVLADQRGTGKSHLRPIDAHSLHVDRFLDDIDALRRHLGVDQVTLVGWSWGAALAMMYSLAYPGQVARLAMVSPGPIPYEMVAVYLANLLRPLAAEERHTVAMLLEESRAAFQTGNPVAYNDIYRRRMEVMFRIWFYDPLVAQQHLPSFLEAIDPYRAAHVEEHVIASLGQFQGWQNMAQLTMPALVLYGYQDFEPITQAYILREWMPQLQIQWLNECGHWPWLEQPEQFYPMLEAFLRGEDVS
jgi:proline iminopeptidase